MRMTGQTTAALTALVRAARLASYDVTMIHELQRRWRSCLRKDRAWCWRGAAYWLLRVEGGAEQAGTAVAAHDGSELGREQLHAGEGATHPVFQRCRFLRRARVLYRHVHPRVRGDRLLYAREQLLDGASPGAHARQQVDVAAG